MIKNNEDVEIQDILFDQEEREAEELVDERNKEDYENRLDAWED